MAAAKKKERRKNERRTAVDRRGNDRVADSDARRKTKDRRKR